MEFVSQTSRAKVGSRLRWVAHICHCACAVGGQAETENDTADDGNSQWYANRAASILAFFMLPVDSDVSSVTHQSTRSVALCMSMLDAPEPNQKLFSKNVEFFWPAVISVFSMVANWYVCYVPSWNSRHRVARCLRIFVVKPKNRNSLGLDKHVLQ